MLKAVRAMLVVLLNIVLYGFIVFGAIQLCRAGYHFAYATVGEMTRELPPGRDERIVITEGETEYQVATQLAEKDLIRDRYSFYLRMQLEKGESETLRVGTFVINSSMTYAEICSILYLS